jgi:signal transduction histidine kinase
MAQTRHRSAWFPRPARPDSLGPLFWLVVGVLASYIFSDATLLSTALFGERDPVPKLVVPLFLAQAVVLSVLLLTPPRRWWVYLLAYSAIHAARSELIGFPRWLTLLTTVADVVEPLVGALVFRRLVPRFTGFAVLREVLIYVGCVVLGAMLGSCIGATGRAIRGFPFWTSWQGWFLADVLASLVLAPTIILWVGAGFRGLRAPSFARATEATILYAGLIGVGWLVFASGVHDPDAAAAWLYLPVPLLLWAAVRFGPRGLMSGLSLLTVLAIVGMSNGLGPAAAGSTVGNVLTLQIFLLGVGVPLFILAVLVREREESERRYRAVASNYPQGMVLLFGPDTRHLIGDGQGLPEFGLSPDSVAGTSLWEAFSAEVAAALAPRYQAALTGKADSCEVVHAGRTYRAHVLPIDPTGPATGMVVMQDITVQRRAQALAVSEAALRATNEQLEAVSRAKSEFLSVVSHEARTPLGSIRGFSEMLRDDDLSPKERVEYAGLINTEAQRLGRLVEDLLDLDRLESGRVDLRLERVDLGSIVAAALEQAAPTTNGHVLRSAVEPSLPCLRGDPDKLAQVVENLVANAIKYSPRGGVITVGASREDEQAHLWVQDEGIGIPVEMLETIFERYTRVESAEHRAIKGTGLGLPIVRQIAELHDGQAWAESQWGRGSRLHVTLPIAGPPGLR